MGHTPVRENVTGQPSGAAVCNVGLDNIQENKCNDRARSEEPVFDQIPTTSVEVSYEYPMIIVEHALLVL